MRDSEFHWLIVDVGQHSGSDAMIFDNILNWKLLKGSHGFPGPDGGTCINEAAIVAADFKYRAVKNADDCPPCFSRPISAYIIRINDAMPDDLRQELLMPFVTRLAGTADKPEIEIARAQLMAIRTVRDVLPMALHAPGLARCAAAAYAADAASYAAAATSSTSTADAAAATAAAAAAAAVTCSRQRQTNLHNCRFDFGRGNQTRKSS